MESWIKGNPCCRFTGRHEERFEFKDGYSKYSQMSGVYNVCICIYFLVYFIHYYKYYVMKRMQYNMYIYIYTYAKGGSSNANVLNFVCCLKQAAQFECKCQADAKV